MLPFDRARNAGRRDGAPRVRRELACEGSSVSRQRVARPMREAGLKAKGRRKYKATTDSGHALPVAPNLLQRDFHAERPNLAWVSDVTYVATREGWLYLAAADALAPQLRNTRCIRRLC